MSIREISKRTGLARNTVKKHLRSEESEPSFQRWTTPSRLHPYAERLATWLVNTSKAAQMQGDEPTLVLQAHIELPWIWGRVARELRLATISFLAYLFCHDRPRYERGRPNGKI